MPIPALNSDQIRSRLRGLESLLQEPCTSTDRANARQLVADTLNRLPATDVVGPISVTRPISLDRMREADGADMREVL